MSKHQTDRRSTSRRRSPRRSLRSAVLATALLPGLSGCFTMALWEDNPVNAEPSDVLAMTPFTLALDLATLPFQVALAHTLFDDRSGGSCPNTAPRPVLRRRRR